MVMLAAKRRKDRLRPMAVKRAVTRLSRRSDKSQLSAGGNPGQSSVSRSLGSALSPSCSTHSMGTSPALYDLWVLLGESEASQPCNPVPGDRAAFRQIHAA